MSLGLTTSQKYMLHNTKEWTTFWGGDCDKWELDGFEPCFEGEGRTNFLEDIELKAEEFWIDYNYEVAQGRKTGNGVFEWLDEDEEEDEEDEDDGFGTAYYDGDGFADCDPQGNGNRLCPNSGFLPSKWCSECVYLRRPMVSLN